MPFVRLSGVGIEIDEGFSEVLIGLGALAARTSGLLAATGSVGLLRTLRKPKIPITMAPTTTNAMAAQINGLDPRRFGCGSAAANGETPAPAKPVIVGTVCFGGDVGGIGVAGDGSTSVGGGSSLGVSYGADKRAPSARQKLMLSSE